MVLVMLQPDVSSMLMLVLLYSGVLSVLLLLLFLLLVLLRPKVVLDSVLVGNRCEIFTFLVILLLCYLES